VETSINIEMKFRPLILDEWIKKHFFFQEKLNYFYGQHINESKQAQNTSNSALWMFSQSTISTNQNHWDFVWYRTLIAYKLGNCNIIKINCQIRQWCRIVDRFATLTQENPVIKVCCFIDSDLNFSIFHNDSVCPTKNKKQNEIHKWLKNQHRQKWF